VTETAARRRPANKDFMAGKNSVRERGIFWENIGRTAYLLRDLLRNLGNIWLEGIYEKIRDFLGIYTII
jgi:hypothetical protein